MNEERLQYLYRQYQSGHLTEAEQEEWHEALNDQSVDPALLNLLDIDWHKESIESPAITQDEQERIYQHIIGHPQKVRPFKTSQFWPRIVAAASIILVLGLGVYYLNLGHVKAPKPSVAKYDVLPGGNIAYLTLFNGEKIALKATQKKDIARQGSTMIKKTADGQITYYDQSPNHRHSTVALNTLETPYGGQYQVILPDGTQVWLNAGSSLTYPSSFANMKERHVRLKGEAYFQVARDKQHAFIVSCAGQRVRVLGTHFNINSYANERTTYTTLLEGSIQVNEETILKPGEQASLNEKGQIKVANIDVQKVVGWKQGKFVFSSEDLESIMRKLARWYDIEVSYEGDFSKETFTGSISRNGNISAVLNKIAFTQAVHFKIEGRRVTVMK